MKRIAQGRKILGLDLIAYSDEGDRLDFFNTTVIRLFDAVLYFFSSY